MISTLSSTILDLHIIHIFKIFYLFILGIGEGREIERKRREIHGSQLLLAHLQLGTWPALQACALSSDLFVHRPALKSLSHASKCHIILLINTTLN